ncbi:hypothetical protein [Patulibacter minatonensis]|uniref:hypothetical protein n=1 Tax=Patulibacter minatonensis TaxID=298163 RepID=UPI0006890225|nr:hypothetical protein [Patulibacter minatonensis]
MWDDGDVISFQALRRGTPVRSTDGVEIGTVRHADAIAREHLFDGIVIDTPDGKRFLDAPEVLRIHERAVLTTFPAAEAGEHLQPVGSKLAAIAQNTTTARRLKRLSNRTKDRAKNAWDRR